MALHRRIMTEFLELYREHRCLWDNTDVLYSNKEARERAYEILLDKYKRVQEDATVLDVKRRIENMRGSYRREHKKVLMSRLNDEEEFEYTPYLWYYHLLTFLDEVSNYNLESSKETEQETIKPERLEKKRNISDGSIVYFSEQQDDYYDFTSHQDMFSLQDYNNHSFATHASPSSETEAFGTTVGLQLKELDPMQRLVAEKIISDIIFHARLKKLTTSSTIVIGDKGNSDIF